MGCRTTSDSFAISGFTWKLDARKRDLHFAESLTHRTFSYRNSRFTIAKSDVNASQKYIYIYHKRHVTSNPLFLNYNHFSLWYTRKIIFKDVEYQNYLIVSFFSVWFKILRKNKYYLCIGGHVKDLEKSQFVHFQFYFSYRL